MLKDSYIVPSPARAASWFPPPHNSRSGDLGKALGPLTLGVLLLVPFFGKQLESSFSLGFIGYYFLYYQTKNVQRSRVGRTGP
jgi:hypothetical protein